MEVLIGCCGLQGRQASYYEEFPVVEVQRSFYQMPQMSLASRWRTGAPDAFTFTMKAWQLVTHRPSSPTYRRVSEELPGDPDGYGDFRATPEVDGAWERTLAWGVELGATIMVFQCPRSFRPGDEAVSNMRSFFTRVDRGGMEFVWEPRGWPDDLVSDLCRELDLVHCVDPFLDTQQHGAFAYFRLHGLPAYNYRHRYSEAELRELWAKVDAQVAEGRVHTYVMMNNWYLLDDARRLRMLRRGA